MKQCTTCKREYNDEKVFCPYDGVKLEAFEEKDPHIGLTIDNKYQISYKIAEGGMGNVYYATHLQLNAPVAVKVMHSTLISDSTAIERFRREAQAAMKIHHTNAIALMDFGVSHDGLVYLVMEYLTGCTLRQRLKEVGHFHLAEVNNILQQICAAVNVAHKRKIIHRDLKPENIFLQEESGEEIVKVLDFGIAKLKDQGSGLTRQGMVIGTPHYMSPEQCVGSDVDTRSDIYSLGVIAFEMLTGKLPFEETSHVMLAVKKTSENPRNISDLRPDIPSQICRVVMKAIGRMPDSRFQTALDFAKDFELALYSISATRQLNIYPIDPDKTEQLPQEIVSVVQELDKSEAEPAYNTENHDYVRPTVVFEESISTGSGERLTPTTSDIGEPEKEISRDLIKGRKPIWVPATSETTYPVTCERCGDEVGRSVIQNSTIICPTCRTKMRGI